MCVAQSGNELPPSKTKAAWMLNDKLRVGIVGLGGIALDQHLPGWAKIPFVEIGAAADLSHEALERAHSLVPIPQRFRDWQDLVGREDIDIVDICTPNSLHVPVALAALASGKHVLCEKPLATSAGEAWHLSDASRRAGRLLMAAQHLRYDPVCRQLKGLIDAGMLGAIHYTRAQWLRRRLVPARSTFIERRLSGGGAAMDIGVHILDLAYWFLGAPEPVSVSASAGARLAHRTDLSGGWGDWDRKRFDVEDFAAGFVRFADDSCLALEASWLTFQPEREITRLQCFGTLGGLTWPDGMLVGETNRVPWSLHLDEVPEARPHQELIRAFAIAAYDGLPAPIPLSESLNVIRILEALYRSAQQRCEVRIERQKLALSA
jgi:predicted dehydrogenase